MLGERSRPRAHRRLYSASADRHQFPRAAERHRIWRIGYLGEPTNVPCAAARQLLATPRLEGSELSVLTGFDPPLCLCQQQGSGEALIFGFFPVD